MNDIFTARIGADRRGHRGSTVDIAIDEEVDRRIGEAARKAIDADIIIDGTDRIAVPGMVNTHPRRDDPSPGICRRYATWGGSLRKIWPLEAHLTGDDVYGTKLACRDDPSGTVAFNDMLLHGARRCRR